MATITVKEENPLVGAKRKKIMEAVNNLTPTAVNNLEKLLDSPKAMGYLENNMKFLGLKAFI
jgi:hypothetical protein